MRFIFLVSILAFVCAADLGAQVTLTKVAEDGDSVPGVGNITSIDNLAVNNSGAVRVEVDTDNPDTTIDGAIIAAGLGAIRTEGESLADPVGASIGSFDDLTLNNLGESGVNFFLDGTSSIFDDSGIFFGATLVIQEGDTTAAVGLSAGTPYIGFFGTKFNDARQILIMASVDDPAISSSVDRALIIAQVNGSGALLSETLIAKESDVLPGQASPVTDFGTGPHDYDFNADGDALYVARIATGDAVYLNSTLLAQEGSASPVAGRNWENLGSTRVSLSDNGDWVMRGNLDGDTADDDVIVSNGNVVAREGDSLADISPFVLNAFSSSSPVHISSTGQVLWYGTWNDPDTSVNAGLFLDDKLIVQKGVTQVGGATITLIAGATDSSALSDDGSFAIFEGQTTGGVDGAFRINFFTLLDPDPGLAGMANDFSVKNGTPLEKVFFAYSLQPGTTNVPGCPGLSVGLNSPVVFGSPTTNASGNATINVSVPGGASGRTIYLQAAQKVSCRATNRVAYTFP